MLKLDSIAVDVAAEHTGRYVEIPEWEGVKLGVRSLENEDYKIALEEATERLSRKYAATRVPPKERETTVGAVLADKILFGWEGIDPKYTPEIAKELMSSERGRNLTQKVIWAAQKIGVVQAEFVKDAVKN